MSKALFFVTVVVLTVIIFLLSCKVNYWLLSKIILWIKRRREGSGNE